MATDCWVAFGSVSVLTWLTWWLAFRVLSVNPAGPKEAFASFQLTVSDVTLPAFCRYEPWSLRPLSYCAKTRRAQSCAQTGSFLPSGAKARRARY